MPYGINVYVCLSNFRTFCQLFSSYKAFFRLNTKCSTCLVHRFPLMYIGNTKLIDITVALIINQFTTVGSFVHPYPYCYYIPPRTPHSLNIINARNVCIVIFQITFNRQRSQCSGDRSLYGTSRPRMCREVLLASLAWAFFFFFLLAGEGRNSSRPHSRHTTNRHVQALTHKRRNHFAL